MNWSREFKFLPEVNEGNVVLFNVSHLKWLLDFYFCFYRIFPRIIIIRRRLAGWVEIICNKNNLENTLSGLNHIGARVDMTSWIIESNLSNDLSKSKFGSKRSVVGPWPNTLVSKSQKGVSCGVMVKVMDCRIVVSESVLQSRYYVHFRANTLGKGMNTLILPAMG